MAARVAPCAPRPTFLPIKALTLPHVTRHAGWLEQLGNPEAGSLWAEFAQAASARARVADPESPLPERLAALVPPLWPCLW
jgi:hypothetical protein